MRKPKPAPRRGCEEDACTRGRTRRACHALQLAGLPRDLVRRPHHKRCRQMPPNFLVPLRVHRCRLRAQRRQYDDLRRGLIVPASGNDNGRRGGTKSDLGDTRQQLIRRNLHGRRLLADSGAAPAKVRIWPQGNQIATLGRLMGLPDTPIDNGSFQGRSRNRQNVQRSLVTIQFFQSFHQQHDRNPHPGCVLRQCSDGHEPSVGVIGGAAEILSATVECSSDLAPWQAPVRSGEMAGIAVWVTLKIVLMLRLSLPERPRFQDFSHHFARPET